MKFEIRYDPEKRGIYATRATVVLISVVVATILVLGGLTVYRLNQSAQKLQTPEDKNRPLSLGVAPVKPEALPANGKAASEKVIAQIKKEYVNKFTLIFFYDDYSDQNEALNHIEILKTALDVVEPFKSLKDHLAYKIFTTEGQKCRVEGSPKKILACNPELIESFKKLGIDHYKIVILSPKDFIPASQTAYGANTWIAIPTARGVLSPADFKRWLGIIFTQELGHALGLRYEYAKGKPSNYIKSAAPDGSTPLGNKPGKPNCAPDEATARNWWGNYVSVFSGIGYFRGCAAGDNYIYPEQETLMSNLPAKESYGRVSEDYLRGVISCFYASGQSIVFPAGQEATYSAKLATCADFKTDFPNFWEE